MEHMLQHTQMLAELLRQEPALVHWVDKHVTDSKETSAIVLKLLQTQK
jgi:hypothetical protein